MTIIVMKDKSVCQDSKKSIIFHKNEENILIQVLSFWRTRRKEVGSKVVVVEMKNIAIKISIVGIKTFPSQMSDQEVRAAGWVKLL